MTRWRKVGFGVIVVLFVMLSLEGAARGYSWLRHGNPKAPAYGVSFARNLVTGGASLDVGWGVGRGGVDPSNRDAVEGVAAQQLFDHRDDPSDGLTQRAPWVVTSNSGIPASINSWGLPGPEIEHDPPTGVTRIVAFGGSDVFGAYLRDEETWESRLQRRLTDLGLEAEVINAGNSGANIHDVLQDVIRLTNHFRVDIAVVMNAYNNHPLLPVERRYPLARRTDFYLYNLSLFYVMLKEKGAKVFQQPLDYGIYSQRVQVRSADIAWLVNLYEVRLRQIAVVCAKRKIRLVFSSQPELFFETSLNQHTSQTSALLEALADRISISEAISIAELEYYLQGRLNVAMRGVSEESGATFFDGEATLMVDKTRNFVDQIHPNERGAERYAAALAETLTEVFRP